ncbi:OPT oligopeptide transporter [Mrakia frigida]|uniref:OPT family oligopeptide transporter n=1 Tax=Mrakia frigida TaxID=29902 RepID=UPI003FCC079D
MTWRFYVLSGIFTALGAWLTQLGFFRTTYIPYSIYFVQIASLYFGRLLAATMPHRIIGRGRFSLNLNPGPFSVKEHVAIVLAANTGATNNLGDYVLAPLDIFYNKPMNGWIAILFMWSAVFVGFSLASLARRFLVDDPRLVYPLTLQQVSVFKAMRNSFELESSTTRRQMKVFWCGILAFFLWQFLPEYAMPLVSSLTILCWVSKNPNVVFAGSGLGGVGFMNITLDWSNIGSSFIYQPFFVQTNIFLGSIIGCWILVPIGYYTGVWDSDKYDIQSQALHQANGTDYPTAKLLNADYTLNDELFAEVGVPRISAQLMWGYFFSYTAYVGAFVSLALFQGPGIYRSFRAQLRGERVHKDKLSNLIAAYPQVPIWWNVVLFVVPVAILVALTATGILYMPIYALFVALAFGTAIVIPMGYVYAVSGYQVPVGYFNEIVYGYLINLGGSRHPVGSLSYRVISGQAWYEACSMLSDMKLGHYFHIPPRQVLLSQIWGIVIGVPVNYLTIVWVCNTKRDFLSGAVADPQRQWTGQTVISLNNQGIQFALVGPKKLFNDPSYTPLLHGFVLGAVLPFLLYGLHWKFPKARFDLYSIPIFATTFENFYGNISTGWFTMYALAVANFFIRRNKYEFWEKYAYLAGAAADTGYNLNMLFLFIAFSAVKTIPMPNWWGNNADSVERCFPAES